MIEQALQGAHELIVLQTCRHLQPQGCPRVHEEPDKIVQPTVGLSASLF
jgi:hypothetical protein